MIVQVAGDLHEEDCKKALEEKIESINADFYLTDNTSVYRSYLKQINEGV